ncbi:NAD(P)-dependent oxidoreductase [Paenibacillus endoradicis]|uniref:NAD(P)-dependent oxidoreductase n=1 Tax=Paenibacillus endoradicis TaxID=2972487 RepID=UPI0021598E45|nr:NAD(P)-dependent oxidoreductase [Paenibacillus endoradicis]MCR8657577.1 NAD(P)-dependent oxidoreductase [Paenibacillus endoradicis]
MKIAVIGASGKAGSNIVEEALNRGFEVTAFVRDASKVSNGKVNVIEKDIQALTTEDIKGFDVVVNAFGAPFGSEQLHVELGQHLIDIFQGVSTRLIVVGGAGSLYVDPELTTKVMDTADFPEMFYATASNQGRNLEDLKASSINWTFLSPGGFFDPEGKRSGTYKVGGDQLILNDQQESYISYSDYAIAIVDEIDNANHVKARFSVVGPH